MNISSCKNIVIVTALTLGLAACADNPNRDTEIGAVTGAVLGGVLGKQVSHAKGAPIVGAVVGAIAGGSVGGYMDRQRKELKDKLAEEERQKQLSVTTMDDGSLKVAVAADVSFDSGSAQLRPEALAALNKLASTLGDYSSTVIHVVGHTDSVGSPEFNQSLSERRAASVGDYLARQGVPAQRLREEGRGERELLIRTGDNVAEPRNRRVDIVIKAIVQGNEQAAYTPPGYLGG
jgi:outer membrane protein OmpA-like peptidoglycan-associated protein